MDDAKTIDILVQMTAHMASIDQHLSTLCDRLADHERRICAVEHPSYRHRDGQYLHRLLYLALIIIAVLTGAARYIAQ